MRIWKAITTPFTLLWEHSSFFYPGKKAIDEAQNWTDYLTAAVYFVVSLGFLYFLGGIMSPQFTVAAIIVLAAVIAVEYLWQ